MKCASIKIANKCLLALLLSAVLSAVSLAASLSHESAMIPPPEVVPGHGVMICYPSLGIAFIYNDRDVAHIDAVYVFAPSTGKTIKHNTALAKNEVVPGYGAFGITLGATDDLPAGENSESTTSSASLLYRSKTEDWPVFLEMEMTNGRKIYCTESNVTGKVYRIVVKGKFYTPEGVNEHSSILDIQRAYGYPEFQWFPNAHSASDRSNNPGIRENLKNKLAGASGRSTKFYMNSGIFLLPVLLFIGGASTGLLSRWLQNRYATFTDLDINSSRTGTADVSSASINLYDQISSMKSKSITVVVGMVMAMTVTICGIWIINAYRLPAMMLPALMLTASLCGGVATGLLVMLRGWSVFPVRRFLLFGLMIVGLAVVSWATSFVLSSGSAEKSSALFAIPFAFFALGLVVFGVNKGE